MVIIRSLVVFLVLVLPQFAVAAKLPFNKLVCNYDPSGSPFTEERLMQAVELAKHTWGYGTALEIVYVGVGTDETSNCSLKWGYMEAYGDTYAITIGEWILDSEIRLSSNKITTEDMLDRAVVHEIGHAIGLVHDKKSEIMYPYYRQGSDAYRVPNLADLVAVATLYPKYFIDGKPAMDCSARTFDLGIVIPVVDKLFTVRMIPVKDDSGVVVSWAMKDFAFIDQMLEDSSLVLCRG